MAYRARGDSGIVTDTRAQAATGWDRTRRKKKRPAMPACFRQSTAVVQPFGGDTAIDLLKNVQRHRTVLQHFGVELAYVEAIAKCLLGTSCALLDLQLPILRPSLARPRDVALGLGGGLGLAFAASCRAWT